MIEYLDIFDKNEKHLGSRDREECHKPNIDFYHKVVWVWLINNKKEILIQQRSFLTKARPGRWGELSAAGHVIKDENPEQACKREIYEEIGVKVDEVKFLKKYIYEPTKEIVYFYTAIINNSPDEFILQEDEVNDVKFISFDEFKDKLNNNIFGNYPDEYKKFAIKTLSKLLSK